MWTKEPPGKPGFYWSRRVHAAEPEIIEVFSPREGDLYFHEFGEEAAVWLSSPGCQTSIFGEFWSEPIAPPDADEKDWRESIEKRERLEREQASS